MLRLAKAFWDIALWRRTPAQLSAFLPPASTDRILTRIVLSVGLPLGFAWAVLALARRRQRFLQTGIALLGVGVLAELVLYPVGSLIHVIGADRLEAVPFGILMLVGLIWYLLACANIWRAALDSGLSLGVAVSVAYLVLSMALEQQLLPDT